MMSYLPQQTFARATKYVVSITAELSLVLGTIGILLVGSKLNRNDNNDDKARSSSFVFSLSLVFFLGCLCFGCYCCYQRKLSQEWQQRVAHAHQDVLAAAAATNNNDDDDADENGLGFESAELFGFYTDSKEKYGEILGCNCVMDILSETPPLNEEYKEEILDSLLPANLVLWDDTLSTFKSIEGRGENRRGIFSIIWGKVSPNSGKCVWLELLANPNNDTSKNGGGTDGAPWSSCSKKNTSELVLVTGSFSHNATTQRPIFRGTWSNREKRHGNIFLRLHAAIISDVESGGSRPSPLTANTNVQFSRYNHQLNHSSSIFENDPLVLHQHTHEVELQELQKPRTGGLPPPDVSAAEQRLVIVYDETIKALLEAPNRRKARR